MRDAFAYISIKPGQDMVSTELPDCLQTEDQQDENFRINEYLLKNGFFNKIEALKTDNKVLQRQNASLSKQVDQMSRRVIQLEVCDPIHE